MEIRTLGLDLGKTSFHAVGFDAQGQVVLRRRFSRPPLMRFVATLPPCLIGMEACCGAHHVGRAFQAHGHDVRLMPPQYVRPFVKAQKNDCLDAEAIGEAVQRPTMRFVPLKTVDQLDLQALHRVRDRLVGASHGCDQSAAGLSAGARADAADGATAPGPHSSGAAGRRRRRALAGDGADHRTATRGVAPARGEHPRSHAADHGDCA